MPTVLEFIVLMTAWLAACVAMTRAADLNSVSSSTDSLNATAFSLVDFYNIRNNSLRVGFEPFYWFTNLFVDLIKLSPITG
jgi:hypothetical protein